MRRASGETSASRGFGGPQEEASAVESGLSKHELVAKVEALSQEARHERQIAGLLRNRVNNLELSLQRTRQRASDLAEQMARPVPGHRAEQEEQIQMSDRLAEAEERERTKSLQMSNKIAQLEREIENKDKQLSSAAQQAGKIRSLEQRLSTMGRQHATAMRQNADELAGAARRTRQLEQEVDRVVRLLPWNDSDYIIPSDIEKPRD